jgi:hypothetical protein
MTDDLAKKINELTKKVAERKAVQQVADSPPQKKNLKSFTQPGAPQAQLLARVGNVQGDPESIAGIFENLADRAKNGNEQQDLEMVLHSQISVLSTLASHFMIKSLGGYGSSEVMQSLPELPLQFANLSLKCQSEMRHCIQLLHDLKNPKKPSQFIKTYVNNQLNELQIQQQEIREELEATKYAKVDRPSKGEAIADDPELEAVEQFNGTSDG